MQNKFACLPDESTIRINSPIIIRPMRVLPEDFAKWVLERQCTNSGSTKIRLINGWWRKAEGQGRKWKAWEHLQICAMGANSWNPHKSRFPRRLGPPFWDGEQHGGPLHSKHACNSSEHQHFCIGQMTILKKTKVAEHLLICRGDGKVDPSKNRSTSLLIHCLNSWTHSKWLIIPERRASWFPNG